MNEPHLHITYPHEPGRLPGCRGCEERCHCIPGTTECVFDGPHKAHPCPEGRMDADHWTCRSNPHLCKHVFSDLHSWDETGDYGKGCDAAAEAQGVGAIVRAWKAAGLDDAFADQTGGMTMVATVEGTVANVVAIADGGYQVGLQPTGDEDSDGETTLTLSVADLDGCVTAALMLLDVESMAASLLEMDGAAIELSAWPQAQALVEMVTGKTRRCAHDEYRWHGPERDVGIMLGYAECTDCGATTTEYTVESDYDRDVDGEITGGEWKEPVWDLDNPV